MKNLYRALVSLAFTAAFVVSFTQEGMAWAADFIVILVWIMGAILIVAVLCDRDTCISTMAKRPPRPTWLLFNSALTATIQVGVIAYSGRPWLAAIWCVAQFMTLNIEQKADELREQRANEDQPAPQVKCPGHR